MEERLAAAIWKIRVDESVMLLVAETRAAENRVAALSAFNLQTGSCYFRDKPLPGGWEQSLDDTAGGFIYLHGFVRTNSPERKGIVALAMLTGDTAWEAHHLALEGVHTDGLLVYNPTISPKRTASLAFDGQPADDIGDLRTQQILLPEHGVCRYRNYEIQAEHIGVPDGWDHVLTVKCDGEVVHRDFLDRNIQKRNPEAFFIVGNCLVYIRGGSEIVTYLL